MYKTFIHIVFASILFFAFSSCMLNAPIETVYIQPNSIKTLETGLFTIGTNAQYYKLSPFAIGKYEVTYDEWRTTYNWAIKQGYVFDNIGFCGSTNIRSNNYTKEQGKLPVAKISWGDAIVWCNARSEQEGLAPVYTYSDGSIVKDSKSQNDDYVFQFVYAQYNHSKNGYRLPTKIEWQFAAQGGISGRNIYPGTDLETELNGYAWSYANANNELHQVGTKKSNSLGLYDMAGNVDEWIWAWNKGTNVDTTTKIEIDGKIKTVYVDPQGPVYSPVIDYSYVTKMGGNINCGNTSSNDTGERTLSSCKVSYTERGSIPSIGGINSGFRVCRTLGEN